MQITRTKKALVAVIALVLVGIFVAVAAVYLPSAENSSAFKDNTVADSGSGADAVSTVSASSTAPSEDGTVPDGYQPSGTSISDISAARGDLDGEFYLTDNITIDSLDTSGNTFSGTLDGNGKTITINMQLQAEDLLPEVCFQSFRVPLKTLKLQFNCSVLIQEVQDRGMSVLSRVCLTAERWITLKSL